jgi:hypothetical protein
MPRMKNPAYFVSAVFLIFFSAMLSPSLIQAQTPRATLQIKFNGNVVTSPQTVMTGQAVNLSYAVSGGSASGCTWQAVRVIAGFSGTTQSSTVKMLAAADFKQPTMKIYWIGPGTETVTLGCYLSPGGQGNVTATFNVQGPTGLQVGTVKSGTFATSTGALLNVTGKVACFDGGAQVGLGAGTQQSTGIVFNANANMPSGSSGVFGWVQIINSDNYQYSGPNGMTAAEKSTGGLDLEAGKTTYIYGTGTWVDDSPSMPLGSGTGFTQASRQFTATMYLMWLADSNQSTIPVPLGYIAWGTGWTVTYAPNSTDPTCKWTISSPYLYAYPFEPSIQYPTWNGVSTIKTLP